MTERFSWEGKPIDDIIKWARERNEKLVHYTARRTMVGVYSNILEEEVKHGFMPESFWDNLQYSCGWSFTEDRRETL